MPSSWTAGTTSAGMPSFAASSLIRSGSASNGATTISVPPASIRPATARISAAASREIPACRWSSALGLSSSDSSSSRESRGPSPSSSGSSLSLASVFASSFAGIRALIRLGLRCCVHSHKCPDEHGLSGHDRLEAQRVCPPVS